MKRRTFIGATTLLGLSGSRMAAGIPGPVRFAGQTGSSGVAPIVVSTWNFAGANEAAAEALKRGSTPLDAVEEGIRVTEADPGNTSVGVGGYPDREGHLTLDASIMEGSGKCGSVVFLEGVDHPISVARLVMEKSPHVILAGDGAARFAQEHGYVIRRELTPGARKAYEKWLTENPDRPKPVGRENHDTIGMLAMIDGKMAGGCSTSGAAWKMHGRVGDSPIIGAGLFVDDGVGAATSTGLGEMVIRIAGSALVVELMRQGRTPDEACRAAVDRVYEKHPESRTNKAFHVAFLALRKDGEVGAYGFGPGFEYAVVRDGTKSVITSDHLKV